MLGTSFTVLKFFSICLDFHHVVTDGGGCLSTAAIEAYCGVCSTVSSATATPPEAGHVTIYVAEQRASYATQQAMLLREAYNQRTHQQRRTQVHVLACMKLEKRGKRPSNSNC